MRAYTVPPDMVHDVAVDGNPDSMVFSIPGQNGKIRFSGNAGQEVSISLGSSVADTDYQILKPNGNELDSGSFDASGDFIEPFSSRPTGVQARARPAELLPRNRHRDAVCRPGRRDRGRGDRLDDREHRLIPGQNAAMTFAGTGRTAGQPDRIAREIPNSTVWIERPNGVTLTQFTTGTSGHFMSPVTLPQNGTYTSTSTRRDPASGTCRSIRSWCRAIPCTRSWRTASWSAGRTAGPARTRSSRSPARRTRRSAWSSRTRRWDRPTSRS